MPFIPAAASCGVLRLKIKYFQARSKIEDTKNVMNVKGGYVKWISVPQLVTSIMAPLVLRWNPLQVFWIP
jgi:hypothetical protein